MQEEIESRIIAVSIRTSQKTARLTEEMLVKAIRAALRKINEKRHTGKQSVKSLMKQGQQLSTFDSDKENLKGFNRIASKYGIDYSIKKDKEAEGTRYVVFFKAKDREVIQKAFCAYSEMFRGEEKNSEQQKSQEKEQDSPKRESVIEMLKQKQKEVIERNEKRREKNRERRRERNMER